jgi:hypothetical protein
MAFASEAGHWYLQPCGTPFYTIIGKNGKERNVTLRDARPVNAVPSYSMVASVLAAPALVNYFKNQVALAAAETPREPTEGVQAYMDRILAISREHAETARDLGTEIHGAIEKALVDTIWIPRPEASAAIKTMGDWAGHCCWKAERSFAHPLGYGGKCDAHKSCEHSGQFLADFKTKDFCENTLPLVYDNHHMQLAAYRQGFGLLTARCAIIYVSTKVPGLTHLVEVPQDDLERGWELFKALLEVWKIKNRYYPNLKGTENGERERAIPAL